MHYHIKCCGRSYFQTWHLEASLSAIQFSHCRHLSRRHSHDFQSLPKFDMRYCTYKMYQFRRCHACKIGSCWTNNWACWLTEWTVERTRVPWKNTFCWSSGQKTYQRIIAPISSFSGGSPPFRGGYDRYCQGVSVSCVLGDQNQNRGRFPSF